MKKASIILALICLAVSIASFTVVGKAASVSKGAKLTEKLISACEAHKQQKIKDCFDDNISGFMTMDSCVNTTDYLGKCGINLSAEGLDKVYVVGSSAVKPNEQNSELSSYFYTAENAVSTVYIGADYTDELGEEQTSVIAYYVIFNEETSKIITIFRA